MIVLVSDPPPTFLSALYKMKSASYRCPSNERTHLRIYVVWQLDGETRLGIFASLAVQEGEPLTYDYRYDQFGPEFKCQCGTSIVEAISRRKERRPRWKTSAIGVQRALERQTSDVNSLFWPIHGWTSGSYICCVYINSFKYSVDDKQQIHIRCYCSKQ
ncbi:hypothetical protein POM88_009748 [Heracleum sosnowskyi]|uniref:SET domain-containing protein n=1 Tax=Heracleum sosnowskyi TaxID=360622 RepID=A0AAD8N2X7_9APIA|nr:hypothetical protein POM88_009748 [Heracleum sosnowskyi]